MNKRKELIGILMLFTAAFIWGVAFVAQSIGMEYIEAFSFNAVRFLLGAIVLVPVFLAKDKIERKKDNNVRTKEWKRNTYGGGAICGVLLCVASMLQQYGIKYTSVSKAGFITSLYIIIVPILGIFLKRKIGKKIFLCVGLALIGLYFLTMSGSLVPGLGDVLVFGGSVLFSVHIMVIDAVSPKGDGVRISCIQFLVSAILCGICAWCFDNTRWSDVLNAAIPLLYTGILSCGVAYTFQVVAQKNVESTKASLVLCLESVVAALAGWLILHQEMSFREFFGCIITFSAVIIAQLPSKKNQTNTKDNQE